MSSPSTQVNYFIEKVNQLMQNYDSSEFKSIEDDIYLQSRSWLLVGSSIFPKDFHLAHRLFLLEKQFGNSDGAAKIFSELILKFPNKSEIVDDLSGFFQSLNPDQKRDNNSEFFSKVFSLLPQENQMNLLVQQSSADGSDPIQQARQYLTLMRSWSGASLTTSCETVSTYCIGIVDRLLSFERSDSSSSSPVNHYRIFLVNVFLPELLKHPELKLPPKLLIRCIQKVLEFLAAFVSDTQRGALASAYYLAESERVIDDPWALVVGILCSISLQLGWTLFGFSSKASCEDQLTTVQRMLSTSGNTKQALYFCTVVYLRAAHAYCSESNPALFSGGASAEKLVLIAAGSDAEEESQAASLDMFSIEDSAAKRARMDPTAFAPSKPQKRRVEPWSGGEGAAWERTFLAAQRAFQLMHSNELDSDCRKLWSHWAGGAWRWLDAFQLDLRLYEASSTRSASLVKDALAALSVQPLASHLTKVHSSLKRLSCNFLLRRWKLLCSDIRSLVSCASRSPAACCDLDKRSVIKRHDSPNAAAWLIDVSRPGEVLSYIVDCIADLVPTTTDLSIGHRLVLLQFYLDSDTAADDACAEIDAISEKLNERGSFSYPLFGQYIFNVYLLEMFAGLATKDDFCLDIAPPSLATLTQPQRTMTRGVRNDNADATRQIIEAQLTRGCSIQYKGGGIDQLIWTFLDSEIDSLTSCICSQS